MAFIKTVIHNMAWICNTLPNNAHIYGCQSRIGSLIRISNGSLRGKRMADYSPRKECGSETQLILPNIVAWVLFNEFSSSEGQIIDFALKINFRLSEHKVQPELHMVRF